MHVQAVFGNTNIRDDLGLAVLCVVVELALLDKFDEVVAFGNLLLDAAHVLRILGASVVELLTKLLPLRAVYQVNPKSLRVYNYNRLQQIRRDL